MQTRRLGTSELDFSLIGLGTWAIGGDGWNYGWGPQDRQQAIDMIHQAVDLGINWIDTAPVYGNGQSECLVGEALRQLPAASQPMLATKCGRFVQADGSVAGQLSREGIIAECEQSLKRFDRESIDLYQIHWPQPDERIEEAWETIGELRAQGKVREGGVCNFSVSQLQRVAAIRPVASLQPPYSMVRRAVEDELLPYCAATNTGVVGYSPMYKGLLTGKFSESHLETLPETDHRHRDPEFQPPRLHAHLALVEGLQSLAGGHGCTPAEIALAWVLSHPAITSAIVGARSPEQITQTVSAADIQLSQADLQQLSELLETHQQTIAAA